MRKEYWYWIIGVTVIFLSSGYIIFKLATVSSTPKPPAQIMPNDNNKIPMPVKPEPEYAADVQILKEPKIAPLPQSGQSYTTNEIREMAEKQGPVFCQSLEDEKEVTPCIEYYYLTQAEREQDPEVCEKAEQPGFVRQCKLQAAAVGVAIAYYEGFKSTGNEDFVPSNIGLCDLLDYEEDTLACKDPKKMIDKNKYELQYKLE